jgi:hypothetical protein
MRGERTSCGYFVLAELPIREADVDCGQIGIRRE